MTRWLLGIVFALALCIDGWGCASADVVTADVLVLSPSPELETLTLTAALRWEAATGLRISIADGGIPVTQEPGVTDADGHRACGAAAIRKRSLERVYIKVLPDGARGCPETFQTLTHEIGHMLRLESGHAPAGALMADGGPLGFIDEVSLAWVCETAPCAWMTPEEP